MHNISGQRTDPYLCKLPGPEHPSFEINTVTSKLDSLLSHHALRSFLIKYRSKHIHHNRMTRPIRKTKIIKESAEKILTLISADLLN